MEEPLLGHNRRRSFPFQPPPLYVIQENVPAVDEEIVSSPIPITPAALKEMIVYGSLESPTIYGSLESPTRFLRNLFSERPSKDDSDIEAFLKEGGQRRGAKWRSLEDRRYTPISQDVNIASKIPVQHEGVKPTDDGLLAPYDFDSEIKDEQHMLEGDSELTEGEIFGSVEQQPLNRSSDDPHVVSSSTLLPSSYNQKRYLRKSRTAPALNVNFSKGDAVGRPKLETSSSVVWQAGIGLLLYLLVGVIIYVWKRKEFSGSSTVPFVDALYFCIVTMCTIGYGDITPISPTAKLFSCIFVLVGFGFIDILLSGMVAYVLERQETLLLSAVEGGHHETAKNYLVNTEKGRMRIRMKVAFALAVVIGCIGIGTFVMHFLEHLAWLDSFYLSCMSVTTVGYGDHTFKSTNGRLFAAIWLLVSTLAVARAFLFLAEARIDKRNRLIAKWVLQRKMTVGDIVAADIDNHGFMSKSEYVIYKLKEMRKISEKDIGEICKQFNELDVDNLGKITISCLMNNS